MWMMEIPVAAFAIAEIAFFGLGFMAAYLLQAYQKDYWN
jgi:hypothetical protein